MSENNNNNNNNNNTTSSTASTEELLKKMRAIASDLWRETPDVSAEPKPKAEKPARVVVKSPDIGIDNLWMTADETIDWTDALAHEYPTDGLTNMRLWAFYHKEAEDVLSGDTKAYAEVLKKANPLGELTEYAEYTTMRAPSADRLESCFVCKQEHLEKNRKLYLAAMGLRIARDLLACLPVEEVTVSGEDNGAVIFTVTYTRQLLLHRNFVFTDPVALAKECGAEFT